MTAECKKCERAEFDELVEKYRLKKEKEILAAVPEKIASYKKYYDEQASGFKFKCQRWGQFLNIYVTFGDSEFETSLNFGNLKRIDIIDGHLPDNLGEIYYYIDAAKDEEKGNRDISFINKYIPNLYKHLICSSASVTAECVVKCSEMPFFGWGQGQYFLPKKTIGAARSFKNDVIDFKGIDFNLEVPFGLGRSVYEKIMKAKDARK